LKWSGTTYLLPCHGRLVNQISLCIMGLCEFSPKTLDHAMDLNANRLVGQV